MTSTQSDEKGKKRKRQLVSYQTSLLYTHTTQGGRECRDHQMIWQKLNFNYCCQLHALPEDNGVADVCRLPFFMYTKLKIPL